MKQKSIFVLLISTIVALLLPAGALSGPPRLVVKPETASRLDKLPDHVNDRNFVFQVGLLSERVKGKKK